MVGNEITQNWFFVINQSLRRKRNKKKKKREHGKCSPQLEKADTTATREKRNKTQHSRREERSMPPWHETQKRFKTRHLPMSNSQQPTTVDITASKWKRKQTRDRVSRRRQKRTTNQSWIILQRRLISFDIISPTQPKSLSVTTIERDCKAPQQSSETERTAPNRSDKT